MTDILYKVTEEYPSGREMARRSHGPGTWDQLRESLAEAMPWADEHWTLNERLDELYSMGVVHCEDGYTFRLERDVGFAADAMALLDDALAEFADTVEDPTGMDNIQDLYRRQDELDQRYRKLQDN